MSKQKLSIPKGKNELGGDLEGLLGDSSLIFLPREKIEEHEYAISGEGHEPGIIDVFGKKVGIVMKKELRGALMDPSGDDLGILENARNSFASYVQGIYGGKGKIPCEASFGRLIEDSYINSLIMNILKFPTDNINHGSLRELGLDIPAVLSIANKAMSAYCKEYSSLDLNGGFVCIDSVGGGRHSTYSGNSSSVDLSSDICKAGSHYKLNLKAKNLQKEIQKKLPVLSKEYSCLESEAVHLMTMHNPLLNKTGATNLFRMMLNLGGLYTKEKPLPLK